MIQEKIPQNIQDLVGEIGERMVLFKLYEMAYNYPDIEVFKNYSEPGYDLVVINHKTRKKLKVEVKTRQRLLSTSKEDNIAHFTLTQHERDKSDFLIGFWIDHNDYFIVPTKELQPSGNGKNKDGTKKLVYKHIAVRSKRTGSYTEKSSSWVNENGWELLLKFIQPSSKKSG